MKTTTNTLIRDRDCKHSVIFKPIAMTETDKTIVTSVYISKSTIPVGAKECKLTISWSEGGQDEAYLKV